MSEFFEKPKIGKPIGAAVAAVVVLAVIAAAIVVAYRAGADSDDEPGAAQSDSVGGAEGLPGADQVYDPLTVVDGAEYDSDLYIFHGYERSYVGAVSAAFNWLSALGSSLDPDYAEQLGDAVLVENANQNPDDWRDWPLKRREEIGLGSTGSVPDGWGLNASPMAYQTRNATPESIEVVFLVRLTATSPYGSTSANTLQSMKLVWTGEDWADSGDDLSADYTALKVDVGEEYSDEAKHLGWQQLIW
ncbi:hypothetical protein [Glycomyces sp. NPDC048151]|uniref:hypothetical protein n=1 Tax=Glycomyces sp. NPDC048151 TaxID=3364002 RepID=UPI0037125653